MKHLSLALVFATVLAGCAQQAIPGVTGLAAQHRLAATTVAPRTGHATSPVPIVNGSVYQYLERSWYPPSAPQSVQLTTTVRTPVAWRGTRNLIDLVGTEASDASVRSDTYERWVPDGSFEALDQMGYVYHSAVSRFTSIYEQPVVQVEVPFEAGHSWNGGGSYRVVAKLANGTERMIWHNGGAYYLYLYNSGTSPSTYQVWVNANGSAKVNNAFGGQPHVTVIGVPVKRNGKYMIPIRQGAGQQYMADWYPGGAMPPSPLDVSKTTDRGDVTLPASCNVPSSVATSGELIANVETQLDPSGSVSTYTTDAYYASGIGLVCSIYASKSISYTLEAPKAQYQGTSHIETIDSLTSYTLGAAMRHTGMRDAMATAEAGLAEAAVAQRMEMRLAALRWRLTHL
jgi:hypothetical protein